MQIRVHLERTLRTSRALYHRRTVAAPRRDLSLLLVPVLLSLIFSSAATAQVSRTDPVTSTQQTQSSSSLNTVLDKGRRLEATNRWGEALSHYEEALREYRDNETLAERHDLAKLHYSVERRYHDHSFLESITALDRSQALSLYTELLQKTNTHYVAEPPWRKLGVRGASAMDLALTDKNFITTNRLQLSTDQLAQVRKEIYQLLGQRTLLSSRDLITFAGDVARLVEVLSLIHI